ncbi:putative 1-acyl-sn-glycerol-3-phosphate acyltransferase 5 [Ananas comosus]|uniref:1-acylglycerol-3-phosphate O-acyltransferase n=1 Tax=Ananas comosus TaxID=4615 RepID=A0A199UZB4_ANACO|nr:putative 1-acyl-sn-glycerol-3-phosphate acyltransferase 5 [Ananas comosus]
MNGSASNEEEALNGNKKKFEAGEPPNMKEPPRHRPLTPLRIFRGVLCLVVILSTAFMMLVYWAPVTVLLFRLFSVHYSRKGTSILFATWLSLWPFLFEKINKTKVVFSGDRVPKKERVLLFANHRTEVDWMYLWDLAFRKGRLGYIKYILKSSLMKLPIFAWGFHILEFIPVERKWEIDESIMRKRLSTFKDPRDPLWLAVFPEGTDYTEQKCIKNQQYAAENGLPILKNVLLPKTRGFYACLEHLRSSLDAVYDVTISYKHRCPVFIDNVFGVDPSEVHMHVQRIPINEIPTSEEDAADWLVERFRLKDQLLSDFVSRGHFPCEGTEGELSTPMCLVNCFVVISLTIIFIYLTLFSSVWFKVYVAFSCAYLSLITYYGVQPPQVLGYVKAMFDAKKTS